MLLLPSRLRDSLRRAPALVVAPIGVGYGQASLVDWALSSDRQVIEDPEAAAEGPALLICERRSLIGRIPRHLPLAEALVLEEADAEFDEDEWRALVGGSNEYSRRTFMEARGWPAGLELARAVADTALALHQHPRAALALGRLLPEAGTALEALRRVAQAPLLIPELHEPLGLEPALVEELADLGYLQPTRTGVTLPRLLRRFLVPAPEPSVSLAVAEILVARRHLEQALAALAEAELWPKYLDLLAEQFEPSGATAEKRLRHYLQAVPSDALGTSAYSYLVGTLERLRGDPSRALLHYRNARRHAGPGLKARIDNARGIALALDGSLEEARRAFAAAIRVAGSGRLEGEARHNRAGLFIQQGRFAEAERDLEKAVASFRESGDYVREARSLQLLALSWHRRGLLEEARKGYEDALELLATLGQPTALLRTNLAEVLLLVGSPGEAKLQLDQAEIEARLDPRAGGYVEANRALWLLEQGNLEEALRRLDALHRHDGLDAHLRAEVELLLARAHRLEGRHEQALAHARAARPLGVGAALEEALCEEGDLTPVVEQARREEARFELAIALLQRSGQGDLEEAFEIVRKHGYRSLLESPSYAPALAVLARQDPAALELFPLHMGTFAGFRVRFLGNTLPLSQFPTRKSAALLLRLALSPRPLARDVLAEEFWGDASNPVHSLQTALYHLNRTLVAQVVNSRKGTLELIYPVALDLHEFERAATEALEASWSCGAQALRDALSLADGEPLADFPEWFEEERRSTESLVHRLWRRLAELEGPHPRKAAEALENLLRLDPYDQDSRRTLIGIYTELGETELARREQERLESLDNEL